jgi:hypothetical protein
MGLSKDLPSIVRAAESVSRASAASCFHSALFTLRDGKAIPIRAPSSWFLTTSTVYSSTTLRPLQAAADPGVHRVSFRCETEFLAVRLLPFEAFPPPTATQVRRRISVSARARVTGRPSPIVPFTAKPCPLVLFRTSRPCSIVGSVAHPAVSSRARSVLPWACPIRPSPSCPPPPHRER